ncbi:MAG: hypothetical protein RLZ14_1331 [Actinomycetota bacterium]|jgi:myo-inositol-1(or 4)-monophosphatase
MSVPHDELLRLATELAVKAGRMVAAGRAEHGIADAGSKSSATDVVTEFDRASERLIVGGILDARPNDGIVGEEGTSTTGTSGVDWLVDPIDGTTNFLYDLPGWAVSIAAATADGTEMGVVYVPTTDELFTAVRGRGALLDGRPIRCSATDDLGLALVATGFSYLPERRALQAARIAALLPHVRDLRRVGAAATDLCSLAAGRVDVYFEEYLGPWDMAAGALIAAEAGCRMGGLDGGEARPRSVLGATPALFDAVQRMVIDIDRAHAQPND